MIIVFKPGTPTDHDGLDRLLRRFQDDILHRAALPTPQGELLEWVLGESVDTEAVSALSHHPLVQTIINPHSDLQHIGRQASDANQSIEAGALSFSQNTFHPFLGLCAVDTVDHVDTVFGGLAAAGIHTARMGAYKPRTSPHTFQGLGAACLPSVFERAGHHGIQMVAMEVMSAQHILEIEHALALAGHPTQVMLQIGTRNCQNFELLKACGQTDQVVLLKRGFGNTLNEALLAAEYIAKSGNPRVIFCLRGIKSHTASPHRNLVDFSQIPVVKRLTHLPVCVDPSHAVGVAKPSIDGITDIAHAMAQGIVAGANMVLMDIHPDPEIAKVDGHQAFTMRHLPQLKADMEHCRETYLKRVAIWQD